MRKAEAEGLQHHHVGCHPRVLMACRIHRSMRVLGEQRLAPGLWRGWRCNRKQGARTQTKQGYTDDQRPLVAVLRPSRTRRWTCDRKRQHAGKNKEQPARNHPKQKRQKKKETKPVSADWGVPHLLVGFAFPTVKNEKNRTGTKSRSQGLRRSLPNHRVRLRTNTCSS